MVVILFSFNHSTFPLHWHLSLLELVGHIFLPYPYQSACETTTSSFSESSHRQHACQFYSSVPPSALFLITPCLIVISVLTSVHLYTSHRYHRSLSLYYSTGATSASGSPLPSLPYTVPFLGHAFAFLAPRPGEFWATLFRSYSRATGAVTLLLGGNTTYILFSPNAVEALFKARGPARDGFNLQIVELGMGIDHKEALRYFGIGEDLTKLGSRQFNNRRKFGITVCWRRRVSTN